MALQISDITRGWGNLTNVTGTKKGFLQPLVSTAAQAAIGAGAGWLGSRPAEKLALQHLMPKLPPEGRKQFLQDIRSGKFRNYLMMTGGVLGGLKGISENLDIKHPVKSMLWRDYMKGPEPYGHAAPVGSYIGGRTGTLTKQAEDADDVLMQGALAAEAVRYSDPYMNKPVIPLSEAKQLIAEDPYMTPAQKTAMSGVMETSSEGYKGTLSGMDVSKGIVKALPRAAIGAGAGLLFGRGTSMLFGIQDSNLKKKLNRYGALAGAAANILPGIFGE